MYDGGKMHNEKEMWTKDEAHRRQRECLGRRACGMRGEGREGREERGREGERRDSHRPAGK